MLLSRAFHLKLLMICILWVRKDSRDRSMRFSSGIRHWLTKRWQWLCTAILRTKYRQDYRDIGYLKTSVLIMTRNSPIWVRPVKSFRVVSLKGRLWTIMIIWLLRLFRVLPGFPVILKWKLRWLGTSRELLMSICQISKLR